MSLHPGVLDIALAKTSDESERETIRRLKQDYLHLLEQQDIAVDKIRENMLSRGEQPPKHSKELQAEIDAMAAEAMKMDESTLKEAEEMTAKEIVSSLGYALKFNVPISRDLLIYLHEDDRPIQQAYIDLQERVADALLEFSLSEADRAAVAKEIAATYEDMKKSGGRICLILENEDEEDDYESYVDAKAIGAVLDQLDEVSERLGTRELSSFISLGPWEPEEWFDPQEGIRAVKALQNELKKKPRLVKKAKTVEKDLGVFLDALIYAKREGVRFCLQWDI
jgi:hypothetical protein